MEEEAFSYYTCVLLNPRPVVTGLFIGVGSLGEDGRGPNYGVSIAYNYSFSYKKVTFGFGLWLHERDQRLW